jgi:hypothetical protein
MPNKEERKKDRYEADVKLMGLSVLILDERIYPSELVTPQLVKIVARHSPFLGLATD